MNTQAFFKAAICILQALLGADLEVQVGSVCGTGLVLQVLQCYVSWLHFRRVLYFRFVPLTLKKSRERERDIYIYTTDLTSGAGQHLGVQDFSGKVTSVLPLSVKEMG